MSGVITSDFLQKCIDLNIDMEAVVVLAEVMEQLPNGKEIVHGCIDGMISAEHRHAEAPQFFRELGPKLLELVSKRRGYTRRDPNAPPPEPSGYPCGPKERWGYDGPITPRLPDRDWWPLRNSIVDGADYTCHYCGDRHQNMCADHVVPLSRGGTNERDNLVCCCIPCNSSKADRLLSEWRGRYR